MIAEKLNLLKHYIVIDSPIPFKLVANPYQLSDGSYNGTDVQEVPAGAWKIDSWKLLPKEYFKENPAFTMIIVYDDTKLPEGVKVKINSSDIDIGEGVAGVNGQSVVINGQITDLSVTIDNPLSIDNLPLLNQKVFLNAIPENFNRYIDSLPYHREIRGVFVIHPQLKFILSVQTDTGKQSVLSTDKYIAQSVRLPFYIKKRDKDSNFRYAFQISSEYTPFICSSISNTATTMTSIKENLQYFSNSGYLDIKFNAFRLSSDGLIPSIMDIYVNEITGY